MFLTGVNLLKFKTGTSCWINHQNWARERPIIAPLRYLWKQKVSLLDHKKPVFKCPCLRVVWLNIVFRNPIMVFPRIYTTNSWLILFFPRQLIDWRTKMDLSSDVSWLVSMSFRSLSTLSLCLYKHLGVGSTGVFQGHVGRATTTIQRQI